MRDLFNDKEIGGRCFGFVIFKNSRSAVDAISDIDGQTIDGKTVKVNEIHTGEERQHL